MRRREKWERVYLTPDRRGATYLCEDCRARNARALAEMRVRWAAEFADMVQLFEAWLREAPLLLQLPDPDPEDSGVPGITPSPGVIQYAVDRFGSFVQVLSVRAAAEQCARRDATSGAGFLLWNPAWMAGGGVRPTPRPSTYRDVVCRYQGYGDGFGRNWTGSLYRLNDERIVLYWHTSKRAIND